MAPDSQGSLRRPARRQGSGNQVGAADEHPPTRSKPADLSGLIRDARRCGDVEGHLHRHRQNTEAV